MRLRLPVINLLIYSKKVVPTYIRGMDTGILFVCVCGGELSSRFLSSVLGTFTSAVDYGAAPCVLSSHSHRKFASISNKKNGFGGEREDKKGQILFEL